MVNENLVLFILTSFILLYFIVALIDTIVFYHKHGNMEDFIKNILEKIEKEGILDYSQFQIFEKETQIIHDLNDQCFMCINTDPRCPKCEFYKEKVSYIKISFPGLKKYLKTIKFAPLSPVIDKEIQHGVVNGVLEKLGYRAEVVHIT